MEMQDAAVKEEQREEDQGAYESLLTAQSKEGSDRAHYSELQKPSEDVYAEACFGATNKTQDKPPQGAMQCYRVGCLILTLVCLGLLVTVIVLVIKCGSTDCPENPVPQPYDMNQSKTCRSKGAPGCYCYSECPTGWLRLDKSCFYLSTFRLSWEKSQKNCSEEGGSLAVISSHKIQNFLTQKGKDIKYWIGLRLIGTTWTWLNNTVVGQSYWRDNVTQGDCGILSSGDQTENNWMKYSCRAYTYYICQLPLQTAILEV
ncbi:early activation antigen CD69 [Dunckerocampus dactyliophorus]|uniref:early activation antigen CD69 n=1 Tax=Dunckerocampus dactyliophorus TaxID=161453 RepID=UPI00240700E4|nr:early activation antigen CD69 [Dunckerocampus dactyliophorus]